MTRLNKYLAERLGVSRREADVLIEYGKVLVNDKVARIGQQVFDGDTVKCDGKYVEKRTDYIYVMLNKPEGYVCSRNRQGDSPTLYELLPKEYGGLKTVGRLDKNSSGLILLTNDGDFAFRMTHPKFVKIKKYIVELDRPLEPLHQQMIGDFGIELKDGRSRLGLERMDEGRRKWQITMSEGRNRQIRRTFGALGYSVVRLHRVEFGKYRLGELKAGDYYKIG